MSRPFVQLYIDHQLVSFQEPPKVLMTYQHIDLHNPTVVKNSFSKTVTVEGTPENNRIFGCFYDMTRINGYDNVSMSGAFFNPSKKVPFELYRNGEIMEQGYVKLDKVQKKKGRITYDITLFGGLGEFLYSLKYKEDGEQMKLSDLDFGVDFNLEVNRDTVKDAWRHITGMKEVSDVYDIVNFAPCYNGIPENFSADKVAIDVESFKSDEALYDSFIKSKDGYTTIDGWMIGELKKEYDEWQIGDLRSYLQRPVIRFKEIVKACCNPENNGGYTVDLDEEFFNAENPYYENAWMTLPLLSEVVSNDDSEAIVTESDGKYTIAGLNDGDIFSLTIPYMLTSNAESTETLATGTWIDYDNHTNMAIYSQIVVYDANDNVVYGSNINSMYSFMPHNDFVYNKVYDAPVTEIVGWFRYANKPNYRYTFVDNSNWDWMTTGEYPTYNLELKNVKYKEGMYFKVITKTSIINGGAVEGKLWYQTEEYYDANLSEMFGNMVCQNIKKGWNLSKKTLLNSENTPCDYFLSYLKMFNLHIWKDMYDKTIYIRQRNNFFTGDIKDIDDYIDRNSDITIQPLTFDSKWLNFKAEYEQNEKLHKEYKDNYGIEYGIQKVDTNYSFDSSSKNLLDNYVFKSCITSRNKDKYYISLRCVAPNDEYDVRPFYLDGFQTLLFNGEGDTTEGTKVTPKTIEIVRDWWKEKYYDFMPKPSFVDKDNKSVGGANVLLFYNGSQLMRDNEGKVLNIKISDDIPQFDILNEGQPCWIWSADSQKVTDTTILGSPYYGDGYIPRFSRYITNENGWVTHSWDFGTPKALYIPDYSINQSSSIYNKYWQNYMRDMYDANTRVVECKVLLKERVVGEWLQRFYYFDGSYWIMNKIADYDVTSNDTTKCELIKVQDKNNYLT